MSHLWSSNGRVILRALAGLQCPQAAGRTRLPKGNWIQCLSDLCPLVPAPLLFRMRCCAECGWTSEGKQGQRDGPGSTHRAGSHRPGLPQGGKIELWLPFHSLGRKSVIGNTGVPLPPTSPNLLLGSEYREENIHSSICRKNLTQNMDKRHLYWDLLNNGEP